MPTPRFAIYARKSTESEDRQVLSIDSQVKELTSYARQQGLAVAEVFTESFSGKAPGRPVFSDVLKRVTRGAYAGVIAWKLDRLARNPVDGAALIWAMEQGQLASIVTPSRTYENTGMDKFWMQLEFGIAKKYVDDLSDNVKRGNRAKLEQGWLPGAAPVGYLNDLATKTIIPDPDRFSLVRKAVDLILTGTSPAEAHRRLNKDWGFLTRTTRRQGGKPLTTSHFYRSLSNPFYFGLIVRGGGSWVGRHEPMMTRDEFATIQKLLGRPNRYHTHKHDFAYTNIIQCGECGASVTAEHKVNRYGSAYTYYHCTKRKRNVTCSQRFIELADLEGQILDSLRSIHAPDSLVQWALENVQRERQGDGDVRANIRRSLKESQAALERRLAVVTEMRELEQISGEEYVKRRQQILSESLDLREQESRASRGNDGWLELLQNSLKFANQAEKHFLAGGVAERREIAVGLGSHFLLRDRKLEISVTKPLLIVAESARTQRWLGLVEGIGTFATEHPAVIRWPKWVNEISMNSSSHT